VGLIGGWLLARLGLAESGESVRWKHFVRAFALAAGVAATGGAIGALLGMAAARGDLGTWNSWQELLNLQDLPGFIVVAYLHWASYLSGLLGLVCAAVYVRRNAARLTAP
jgi:hypothetical protein